jgi:DNA-binding NtrC family response regulator
VSGAAESPRSYLRRVAPTNSTVLITGETGTGKDLAAAAVHNLSLRRNRTFVVVNCAAIPDSLLESELFGHERGAYTGADSRYEGRLRHANGGTTFFDEIGDLSPLGQAKLLRVLECREIHALGAKSSSTLDLRIVAATNRDLEEMVQQGRFRRDLYFRLNVARVHLVPLRERREDIPLLFAHFERALRTDKETRPLRPEALAHLTAYDWPGNIRELRNTVECMLIHGAGTELQVSDLPHHIVSRDLPQVPERDKVLAALASTKGNKAEAARKLNWSRMTLYRKISRYRIAGAGCNDDPGELQCM